ncbi:ComEC/Rec2 family competence protein [Halalkalibacter krulwichiae]|uniref:ComEC family competence protein n=1 Tax=Halalkalibacter krulwichiae TaxID=199441 RepID=A0A1X9MCH9_9BACI|nr:hypothetical protein [Halalkalibacter krulwichiae]ARK30344.1 hypothetical protein BkAM31D_11185 [Halalkalibacter krulwichiae]
MHRRLFGIMLALLLLVVGFDIRITTNETDEEVQLDLQLEEQDIGVVFLDITDGEATYVEFPNNESMLIGTGSKASSDELLFRLRKLNVDQIETVILPRFEEEYSGNVQLIINEFQTEEIIVPEEGLEQAINQYQKLGIDIKGFEADQKYDFNEQVSFQTMPSQPSLMPMLSFIMSIHEKHHIFFSSEANEQLERNWIENGLTRVSLLKVAEFGANEGTSQRFLNEIDPEVAILFSKQNSEVSGQLLERLQETWIDTYALKQNGSVIMKINDFDYEIVTVHF